MSPPDKSERRYTGYALVVDQDVIDDIARHLAAWGYDVGDRPIVPHAGVTPNLRLAVGVALREAFDAATSREEQS